VSHQAPQYPNAGQSSVPSSDPNQLPQYSSMPPQYASIPPQYPSMPPQYPDQQLQYAQYAQMPPQYSDQPLVPVQLQAAASAPVQAQPQTFDPMAQLQKVVKMHNINEKFVRPLRKVSEFDVVFLCDDSGSMQASVENPDAGPYDPEVTRWDELKCTACVVADIAGALDKDGMDFYFMNRGTLKNVTSGSQVAGMFIDPPLGYTPTTMVFDQILADREVKGAEKKLLIIIGTDGLPTDRKGNREEKQLDGTKISYINILKKKLLDRKSTDNIYVSFVACTDVDADVSYMNTWDKEIPNVDVNDDFKSEKKEILKVQGPNFKFDYPEYACKIILGSIDDSMDKLDEQRV
jgi:hypothetical protein